MISRVAMKALCKPYKAMQVRKVTQTMIKWPQMCSYKKGLEAEHVNGAAAKYGHGDHMLGSAF